MKKHLILAAALLTLAALTSPVQAYTMEEITAEIEKNPNVTDARQENKNNFWIGMISKLSGGATHKEFASLVCDTMPKGTRLVIHVWDAAMGRQVEIGAWTCVKE